MTFRTQKHRKLSINQQIKAQAKFDAELDKQCKVPALAGPIIYTNASSGKGTLSAKDVQDLKPTSTRPSANAHQHLPSRVGERLVYRAGVA
jgi:hypothetical protein